jgi:DnaK suppressor protein
MDETTMSDQRMEGLRRMLLERRQTLQREIDASLADYRAGQHRMREESVPDTEDMSVQVSTAEQRISLMESRNRTRDQLDEALRRLDEGLYGICEDCGEQIGEGRLKALPFARRCVACQEQVEILEQIARKEDREDV